MTGTPPSSPRLPDDDRGRPDDDAGWLSALLTELADDPQAPPSTVSPLSVIAAAQRAAADHTVDHAADHVRHDTSAAEPAPADGDAAGAGTVIELRAHRRRKVLTGLVAAACLFGVGVIVVPLALNGNSSVTSSSADANRAAEAGTQAPAAPDQAAPEGAAAAAESEATLAQESAAAAGGAAEGAEQGGPGVTGSAQPSDSGPVDAGVLDGCWPPLDDAATAGLRAALPAGAFGGPAPLVGRCDPAAIAGAVLTSGVPGTGVVVRVTAAEPAACESTVGCVPAGGGYGATDAAGSPVGYVYGNGYQVAVGGSAEQAAAGSGLSTAQLVAAAQAVLTALS